MSATIPRVKIALRNVLVATDFSPCSRRALMHGLAAARHFGSYLHVVHVISTGLFSLTPPEAYIGTSEAIAQAVDLSWSEAETRLKRLLEGHGCSDIRHRVWVRCGAVGDIIRSIIKTQHIDLVVLGTHGRTGLKKLVLGSVAEEILHYASCPVLTVGPHSWESDTEHIGLENILFPTDFSADSKDAVGFVMAVADEFNARLTILHVVEDAVYKATPDWRRVKRALEDRMREMAEDAGWMPSRVEFMVQTGEITDVIIRTAADLHVGLVAFGLKAPSYSDSVPRRYAYEIIREIGCPALSLRGSFSAAA